MIYEGSRYSKGFLLKDGEEYYLAPQFTQYKTNSQDLIYQYQAGDRLDIISKKFYNNPALKWLILKANPQYFTEFDISVGDVLVIPNPMEVDIHVNAIT